MWLEKRLGLPLSSWEPVALGRAMPTPACAAASLCTRGLQPRPAALTAPFLPHWFCRSLSQPIPGIPVHGLCDPWGEVSPTSFLVEACPLLSLQSSHSSQFSPADLPSPPKSVFRYSRQSLCSHCLLWTQLGLLNPPQQLPRHFPTACLVPRLSRLGALL